MTKPKSSTPKPTRPNAHLEERAAAVKGGKGKLLKPKAEAATGTVVVVAPEPQAEAPRPLGTVRVSASAHPGTYGLRVDENGLGLHAAPGASIIVEPVTPTGAGLAVFYMVGARGPMIFDLTRNFHPEFARPFAPGSEVMPLIEVVQPASGQFGRLRADQVEKIHRITGVYTPTEIAMAHHRAPLPLPELAECPEGMGEHYVEGTSAYPLVRPGETVVYDPSRRDPARGALCVLQWNNGTRSVLLTNLRAVGGSSEEMWWTDPVNRPSSREMLERQLKSGTVGMLHASDGPYREEHLREKIVGTVVGILAHQSAVGEPQAQPVGKLSPDTVAAIINGSSAATEPALNDTGLTSEVSAEISAAVEEHAEAVAAGLHDPDDGDEAFARHAARQEKADTALRMAPARSLADLRAKLTYLVPVMSPDMLDRTHVEHLKAIAADMDRLCRERSRPADNHEDADLLRLGERLDRAHAHWRRMEWQAREPHARVAEGLKRLGEQGSRTEDDYRAIWAPPDIDGPITAESDAYNAAVELTEKIWAIPHTTAAGLAVKARAVIVDYFARGNYDEDAALGDDEDMDGKTVRRLIEACCTLAGVDWHGDPIAPPVPDPIFAAIERHLAARVACLGLDDGKDKEGYEAAHDRRQEALEAVESTQPTTVAGLFALARHIDATLTQDLPGQPVEPTIHGHAFVALINACLGLHEAHYPGMDRDWGLASVYHPGFIPSPQHQPAGLLRLDYAIPREAAHLLSLAEAEFERRRQAYVGFHDPTVWPRVAAEMRRDMRMDALAIVAAPARSEIPVSAPDPILAAIQAHTAAQEAFSAAAIAQDVPLTEITSAIRAAYDAADEAEAQAWGALFEVRPTTLPGVLAFVRHLHRHAPGKEGLIAGSDIESALGAVAEGLAGFAPQASCSTMERHPVSTRPDLCEDRAWAVAQASEMDLSDLSALQLSNLFRCFVASADRWLDIVDAPWTDEDPDSPYSHPNAAGRIIGREQDRAAEIRTRIVEEMRGRTLADDADRSRRLEMLIQYELLCEGSLRHAPALRAEIAKAWGD